ncbi:unnamed protein product [Mytilus edulis]|uniref:Uncharacterized protein n=1 Tax=Mytilus edulis TaxID=6550 RepID=A0A8S3TCK8_MYTED|nr:unnamed protein product [Mytilus edulis]
MFSKAFSTCKKYEDNEEFCSLVLKLFGSQEDKRIASLVADWAKSRKYESCDKVVENTRAKVQNDNPGQNSEEAIHVKEAFALLNTLKSVQSQLMDHRVDAFCDNMAVVKAWENQGGRDPSLNAVLKDIFYFTHEFNMSLHVHFIASADNPADKESRRMSRVDAKLSDEYWRFVEDKCGPHSIDLMALDSNVMLDSNGQPLKHFTPFPCKSSSGVNIFRGYIKEMNPYVFRDFIFIFTVFRHLQQCKVSRFTMIVPSILPKPTCGRRDKWYDATSGGNPACSLEVKKNLKAIQLEQAKSHVQQKQEKPLFIGKLKSVCEYLDARIQNPSLSLAEKYVVLRYQAFFKLQYFSGDRANDLGLVLIQEVKRFQSSSGIIFSHTVGKTLGNSKVNEFSVFRMEDKVICPVFALERYIEEAKDLWVTLKLVIFFVL